MKRQQHVVVAEQILPHNLEAERAVLGSVLMHNDAFELVTKTVHGGSFFRDAHRRVFEAMARLMDRPGGCVDMTLLTEELKRRGELEECGGPVYLFGLVDGMPRRANVTAYAEVVREKALLRNVIAASNQLLSAAYEEDITGDAMLLEADKSLLALQQGMGNGHLKALSETSAGMFARMEYRAKHRGELLGVPTGFKSIDELTLGWQKQDLIFVGARPSIGKTTFVMNSVIAAALAAPQLRAVVFSMEMKREQLEDRILSSLSGVPLTRLQTGCIIETEWPAISAAQNAMWSCGIRIDDTRGQTVQTIRSACRRQLAEAGLDLVIIDYAQLMAGSLDRRGATRTEELTDISRRLFVMAGELDVPLIVTSQLSRAGAGRADPRPLLSDLRECGAFEQDACMVAFLHRKHHRQGGVTNFIVEKQRTGPGGTVNITLDRDIVTFTDGGEEPPAPEPTAEEKAERQKRAIIRKRAHSR